MDELLLRLRSRTERVKSSLVATTLAAAGVVGSRFGPEANSKWSLLRILHAPKRFTRRADDFSANICGTFAPGVKGARYRLNDGPWRGLVHAFPRVPPPLFTIELRADELRSATNYLEIEAVAFGRKPETTLLQFDYDAMPIALPSKTDWSSGDLDVQDGHWEHFAADGGWRVRPVPGSENYDRILVVTGAFAGGRRVETDLVFRNNAFDQNPFGFGVLSLWGGHPDDPGMSPRRGWNYGLAWFFSHYKGVGIEFSYKHGNAPLQCVSSYRTLNLVANRRYFLIVECWSELDTAGCHLRYRQRMKWWGEGEPAPDEWIELADTEGSPIPAREYGVAVIAHHCQADFGPVVVTPLETVTTNK